MEYKNDYNVAFIDGQNLNLGIQMEGWKIDHQKFRDYLTEKYNVKDAYYFLGYINEDLQDLYDGLQKAGFIVKFKNHAHSMKSKKKGNVDTEIVFEIMKRLNEGDDFNKVVLISGDGDYKRLIDYLIEKKRFLKVLFPNKAFASSLFNRLTHTYFDYLVNVRNKIELI